MREQYGTVVCGIGYCAAELERCIRSLHAKFLRRLLQRRAFRRSHAMWAIELGK